MERMLSEIARRAPFFMLTGVVIGLSFPDIASALRPLVITISIVMVVVSMLRVEPSQLTATLKRPLYVLSASALVLVGLPIVAMLIAHAAGAPGWLVTGLTYASAAPPLTSAAAFAILVGANPAFVTGVSIPATIIAPATVWLLTSSFDVLGQGVEIGPLVVRLLVIVIGSFLVALIIRQTIGERRVNAMGSWLDGATVLLVTMIAIGVMHEIGIALRANPLEWIGILATTAVLSFVALLLGVAVFWPFGRDEAFAVGMCAGIKNMAVMVAAVLGNVDPRISLVVITAQFPIFLSPFIMRPLFSRLRTRGASS